MTVVPAPGARSTGLMIVIRTLALASAGGWALHSLNVPLGWLLGALAVTTIATQLFAVHIPRILREVTAPVLGVLIGSTFTPALLSRLGDWPAGIAIVLAYTVLIAVLGFLYFRFVARFDPMTSFFAGIPGGLSEMTLLGISLGAKPSLLAVIHSLRVITIVVVVPLAVGTIATRVPIDQLAAGKAAPGLTDIAVLVACGVLGFGLYRIVRMPAGALLCPLLFSAAAHLMGLTASAPPPGLVGAAQIVLGSYIGVRFVNVAFGELMPVFIHGLIWALVLIFLSAAIAMLSNLWLGIEWIPLMLGMMPGGASEMSLLTLSIGVEVAFVSTCQMVRVICVVLVTPLVASMLPKSAEETGQPAPPPED